MTTPTAANGGADEKNLQFCKFIKSATNARSPVPKYLAARVLINIGHLFFGLEAAGEPALPVKSETSIAALAVSFQEGLIAPWRMSPRWTAGAFDADAAKADVKVDARFRAMMAAAGGGASFDGGATPAVAASFRRSRA